MLDAVRIKRPPLGAANLASILQGGWTALAEPGEPFVGIAEADP